MEKPRNENYNRNKEFCFATDWTPQRKKTAVNLNVGKQKISKPKTKGQK